MTHSCRTLTLFAAGLLAAAASPPAHAGGTRDEPRPLVIGHRGASGYLPEHTLEAYALAIELGADFIEPDLVSTKDGVLVARHENEIEATTDVTSRPEFASRRTTKVIDGVSISGFFTEDFTLAELKTLRARERIPQLRPGNDGNAGEFRIPTLQEVIDLARAESRARGRTIGIYPETKHPSYFDAIGLSLEEPLVRVLHANGLRGRGAPVFIQSFEVGNLRQLRRLTDVPLVQLLSDVGGPFDLAPRTTYAQMATPEGLREIARYADGVGANKNLIVPRDASGRLREPTSFVEDAHAAGLLVHAWTFRSENQFLPLDFRRGRTALPDFLRLEGFASREYALFYALGVDGVFSDQPDDAVAARSALLSRRRD